MRNAANHKRGWTYLALVSAGSFAVTAAAVAPASFYTAFIPLDKTEIAYTKIEGTLWNGSVERLSLAGVPLGEVSFQLSPMSVLGLSPQFRLSAQGGAVLGRGDVSLGVDGRVSLSDLNARINLNTAARSGVLGQPAQGFAEVAIESFILTRKRGCERANGTVWTDVLDAPARRYDLPALPLSGSLRCQEGAIIVELAGENNRAGADVTVRVLPNLTYEVTAIARPAEADIASALKIFGFEDDNGTLTYGAAGEFRGAGS